MTVNLLILFFTIGYPAAAIVGLSGALLASYYIAELYRTGRRFRALFLFDFFLALATGIVFVYFTIHTIVNQW
jgi:hypothetical protein